MKTSEMVVHGWLDVGAGACNPRHLPVTTASWVYNVLVKLTQSSHIPRLRVASVVRAE
ncbi:MAG TPA: hypothetical protein VGP19_15340 [Candidatus Acidoferrales bacterium]|nr:hypothetical protein [Candidatus Acidoferrales bacterium]